MKKKILKTIYRIGGFKPFHWLNRQNGLILTYHRFSNGLHPLKISAEEFAAHLDYLKEHCSLIPLKKLVESQENGSKLPPNSVAITIDDGYADAYEIAFPLLRKYEAPATLFAITDFVEGKIWLWTDKMRFALCETKKTRLNVQFENYDNVESDLTEELQRMKLADKVNSILKKLPNSQKEAKIAEIAESLKVEIPEYPTEDFSAVTWEMAREMDFNGLNIESHTVSHPILSNVDDDQLTFELKESKNRIEKKLNKNVEVFCYPNGAFNDNVSMQTEKAGYKYAVTTQYGFLENAKNCFLLNRIDAPFDIAAFAQSVSGFEDLKEKLRN